MAFAEQLPSGKWRGGYRDADGKRRYTATGTTRNSWPSKKLALAWAQDQEADVRRGRWRDPDTGKTLYRDWVQKWWDGHTVEDRTEATDRYRVDKYLIAKWGDRPIADITPSAVGGWVKTLSKDGLSAWTVRRIHQLFKSSLDLAVREHLLASNPAAGVDVPTPPPGSEVYFTRPQIDAITAQMNDTDRFVVAMLVWTGIRWGELAGMHASAIDLKAGLVHVQHTLVEEGSTRFIKAYPKGRQRRAVPIAAPLLPALMDWMVQLDGAKSCGFEHKAKNRCPGGLLISVPPHGCLSRHTWGRDHWHVARGFVPEAPYGRVHDLRHTFASWMLQAGMSMEELQRLLGHSSPAMVQKYAHWSPDNFDRARSVMDAFADQDQGTKRGTESPSTPVNTRQRGERESPDA